MIPFYIFHNFDECDRGLKEQKWPEVQEAFLEPMKEYGLRLIEIDISELTFGWGNEGPSLYYQGEDLMKQVAVAHVSYISPHPQNEQLLNSLGRLILDCKSWVSFAAPRESFLADCFKENIVHLAEKVGARSIPGWLVPEKTIYRSQIPLIEKCMGPYPYILKPNSMGMGQAIFKVDSRQGFALHMDLIVQSPKAYLIQPYIENARDLRVYLEEDQVITCQERVAPKGSYLANISQGASGTETVAAPEILEKSQEIARYLKSRYLAVDWLIREDQSYLLEIEYGGGFFGLTPKQREKVARAFVRAAKKALDQANLI